MYYKYYRKKFDVAFAPGSRMLSNGIPIKTDTYQSCTNFCKYCYAEEMRQYTLKRNYIEPNRKVARMMNISRLVNFMNTLDKKNTSAPFMRWALRNKYFAEVGTTGETFQNEDLFFRTSYNFFTIMSAFQIPIFVNTKLNLICKNEEYKKLLINHSAPIILCLTMITHDDKLSRKYEPLSPSPSERLKTVKELNAYPHIVTTVYTAPFMPGVTDVDPEGYILALLEAGIKGAHVRDFYIQGSLANDSFWKDYIRDNKSKMEPFPGGYHTKYSARKEFYLQIQEIANKYDSSFKVVGMKSKWFELNPCHGKMSYDELPESFKKGITDWTAIPILRKIVEEKDKPQLLFWDEIGYKADKINLPDKVRTNESRTNNVMEIKGNFDMPNVEYEMNGYDWITTIMWDGWSKDKPISFMKYLDYIFPVKDGDDYYKVNNHFVYTYLPKEYWHLLNHSAQQTLFKCNDFKSKDGYVLLKDVKDFYIPKRAGGIEDKWIKN